MDPLTLLAVGPSLVRAIGSLLGGKTAETANNVATIIDGVSSLPAAVAREKLQESLNALPPEQLVEVRAIAAKIADIEKERELGRLQAETSQQAEVQETARVESQSQDEYVRRTRPQLARHSAYFTFAYAFITGAVFQVINAIWNTTLPGIDTWIIGALFAPCLTYMGVRSVDAFSRRGKT